jgi:hypothetical protein
MSSSENEKLIGYVVICISLIMIIHLMWNDNYFKYQNEHMEQLVASPLSKPESIPAPIINVDSNMGCKSNPVPILPPVIQNVPVIDTIKHLGFDDRISEPKTAGCLKMDVMLDTHNDPTNDQFKLAQKHMGREDIPFCSTNAMNNFVGFKDMVNLSSGQQSDLVDKITKVYLGDNMENARGFSGKRISEIYDQLTKSPDNLPCVVQPQANILFPENSYKVDGFRGEMYTKDMWKYSNEKVMNGGQVDKDLYPNDPSVESFKII